MMLTMRYKAEEFILVVIKVVEVIKVIVEYVENSFELTLLAPPPNVFGAFYVFYTLHSAIILISS